MIDLFSKQYNKQTYHCVHFAVDVWKKVTGNDLSKQFAPLMKPLTSAIAVTTVWDGFTEVYSPSSPCVVLMRSAVRDPHMGVYSDGRILHIRQTGPHSAVIPQLELEYPHMRFFVCEK